MSKRSHLLAVLAVTLVSLPAAAEQQWVEVKSPHFSVITDSGSKQGREIALRFEQMRTVFGQIFRRTTINLPVPLQIIAFRNGKEMRPYAPVFQGKPVELSGLFMGGEDRQFILLDLDANNKWEAVFHEYAHQLLNGNFPRMAPWFDEGFAEYFAAMEISGNSFRIGDAPSGRMEIMARSRLMPVSTLFSVAQQSETYNRSGDPRQLFYAESWLMVHYLFDKARLKQADEYFHLINNENVPVDDAIQRAFAEPPKQLDKELADYFSGGHGKFMSGQVSEKFDVNTFPVSPLDNMELRVTLADIHLHSMDHRAEAIKEFEQILAEKPDTAGAHRGLGYAYLFQGQLDKAGEHFHQAARLSVKDPRVYYFSALVAARSSGMIGRSAGNQVPEMKADLLKAIELDPNFADAYSMLGFANMAEGDSEAAVLNAKKAVDLSPRKEMYALNLGRAYLMAGKVTEAKAVFGKLKDSQDQAISLQAQQELALSDRPRWNGGTTTIERETETPVSQQIESRPVKYVRGELLSVDCSQAPAATLEIKAGPKTLKMITANSKKLLLIGADEFSCSWKNKKVLVNYLPGGKTDGDLISVEVQ